jgi:hypothetical protein
VLLVLATAPVGLKFCVHLYVYFESTRGFYKVLLASRASPRTNFLASRGNAIATRRRSNKRMYISVTGRGTRSKYIPNKRMYLVPSTTRSSTVNHFQSMFSACILGGNLLQLLTPLKVPESLSPFVISYDRAHSQSSCTVRFIRISNMFAITFTSISKQLSPLPPTHKYFPPRRFPTNQPRFPTSHPRSHCPC